MPDYLVSTTVSKHCADCADCTDCADIAPTCFISVLKAARCPEADLQIPWIMDLAAVTFVVMQVSKHAAKVYQRFTNRFRPL